MLKGSKVASVKTFWAKRVELSPVVSVIVTGLELEAAPSAVAQEDGARAVQARSLTRARSQRSCSYHLKQAKKLVEKASPKSGYSDDSLIREHPVMLKRAPRLHRLGIQALNRF